MSRVKARWSHPSDTPFQSRPVATLKRSSWAVVLIVGTLVPSSLSASTVKRFLSFCSEHHSVYHDSMISILHNLSMLHKKQRKHVVVMVVLIVLFLLACPTMVQTTHAHDRISIHTTSSSAEGLALCSIADKIPTLSTFPTSSPTQLWSKTPTCPPSSSTSWCSWKGVTCTSGSVTAIDLSSGFGNLVASNGLGKTALSQLTALTNVASFNMAGNSFTGSIPTTIGAMTSLTYLDLSTQASNQLFGTIPSSFSALTNLLSFQLSSNKLTKSIPSFIGTALTKLTSLGLNSNSFTGTIPSTLSILTQLLSLRVDINLLQGTIPAYFGNTLTQMTTLNLASNYFTGTVPAALSAIATLSLTYTSNCLSSTASPTQQTHCLTPTGQPSSQPSRQPTRYWHLYSTLDSLSILSDLTWPVLCLV